MILPLTRGTSALVDEIDVAAVLGIAWHAHDGGSGRVYARSGFISGQQRVYLNRLIWVRMSGSSAPDVDHRDGDGLNCRRGNLRSATRSQNAQNSRAHKDSTSGLKGVRKTRGGRWSARVFVDDKEVHIGTFDTASDAHAAYAGRAAEVFGEFARAA